MTGEIRCAACAATAPKRRRSAVLKERGKGTLIRTINAHVRARAGRRWRTAAIS
jgi:hypothetical protein